MLDSLTGTARIFSPLFSPSRQDVVLTKKRILEIVELEYKTSTIKDENLCHLTQADMVELEDLQKELSIKIILNMPVDDQEPSIILEGMTIDVNTAIIKIRSVC